MTICAVIPAAGHGKRLGFDQAKLFTPLMGNQTIWSILKSKLIKHVQHIHIIASKKYLSSFYTHLKNDLDCGLVSISIQHEPIGMGDAIFCGYETWSRANTMLVIWGDQVNISEQTIHKSLVMHGTHPNQVTLPLTQVRNPYVEYLFDPNGNLTRVLQSREGDVCSEYGWADVGTFVLSTNGLLTYWDQYLKSQHMGSHTNEINFLPFIPYLALKGWKINPITVKNSDEARGVNTLDDIKFFESMYGETIA